MTERRAVERKQFTQPLNLRVSDVERGNWFSRGQGVNISSDGLGMMSDYPLSQGMVLRIRIPVEGFGITLPLLTEVAWALSVEEGYRAGLKFLS